jgi:hypothetical protein
MSERRARRVIGTDRTSVRYQGMRPDDALRERLKALAQERWRFGYRRLNVPLRREGHAVNKKRVQWLYREERLTVRRRGGRKRAMRTRRPITTPLAPNQRWSLDFVYDQLTDGRRFRILTVVDDCTRECLALVAETSISCRCVGGNSTTSCAGEDSAPDAIVSNNGTKLTSNAILNCADKTGIGWQHYIAPAAAERVNRELQRPAARRAAERNAVRVAAAHPCGAGGLAARLRGTAAFQARLDDASGLRQRPQRRGRPGNRRLKSTPETRSDWMKNGGHVTGNRH